MGIEQKFYTLKADYPYRHDPKKYNTEYFDLLYQESEFGEWKVMDRTYWIEPWCWCNLDKIRCDLMYWVEKINKKLIKRG
jgi:hypothetical protein